MIFVRSPCLVNMACYSSSSRTLAGNALDRVLFGEKQVRQENDRLVEFSMNELLRLQMDNNASKGELTPNAHTDPHCWQI